MTVDWKSAPFGSESVEQLGKRITWGRDGYWWDALANQWLKKIYPGDWKVIVTRPSESNFKATRENLEQAAKDAENTDGPDGFVGVDAPRKTVKDAVEYYDRKWPEDADVIVYAEYSEGWRFCGWISDWRWHTGEAYEVCTRAEFEAEVEREKGEGWTHYVEDDVNPPTKCKKHLKLVGEEDDWVYVCEKGEYFVPAKMGFCSVRPIKPNISKAECDAVMSFASKFGLVDKAETYLNNHTVQEHQS